MNACAFIFARGGSKGIKNKNIKSFRGKPLIYYSIKSAQNIKGVNNIFVSSDSNKILKISEKYGAKVIKRPKILSKDNSPEIAAWKHAANSIKKFGIKPRFFISLPCTSPLRIKGDILSALKKIKKSTDLVIGITESDRSP